MNYWTECWAKYATFTGRARRKEYWMWGLGNTLVVLGVFVATLVCVKTGEGAEMMGRLIGLFILSTILPGLAVTVRRLHDTGKSGWMLLISLVPIIGAIILFFIVGFQDSEPGGNRFGANPKA